MRPMSGSRDFSKSPPDGGAALAVIPARGGSRRVPGKNVRLLCGRPAIAYSISAALQSGLFARVVVTTDSPAIAEIATACGADVPFLREPSLSDDHTPVSAATLDALRRVDRDGTTFGIVAQLMPNCPLRDAADVRASHRQFVERGAPAQLSVAQYGWQTPWWAMERTADLELVPLFPSAAVQRSQDLAPLYCPTGAIWWVTARALRAAGTFHVDGRTGWEIDHEHAIDIDTESDWHLAETLMQRHLTAQGHAV